MEILLSIAGFLVTLIAVAGIILLIIAIAKGKIKTPGAPSGKILKTIAVIVILSVLGWFGYRYFTGLPSRQQATAVAQQQWYLSNEQYWKKDGGMDQAQAIKVDITENSLYAVYKILRRERQYGELFAESEDGKIYTGRYQYPGENGDIKLKKISATLYEGTATRPNSQTFKIQLIKSPL